MSGRSGPPRRWADLPPDQQWAVGEAYRGWQSKPLALAEAWGRLAVGKPLEGLRLGAHDRFRLEWLASRSSVPLTLLGAWHSACATALAEVPEGVPGRAEASVMLMDAVNMADLDFGVKAAAAAAQRVVTAGGQSVARALALVLHHSCIPDTQMSGEALAGCRGFLFSGRVYIL